MTINLDWRFRLTRLGVTGSYSWTTDVSDMIASDPLIGQLMRVGVLVQVCRPSPWLPLMTGHTKHCRCKDCCGELEAYRHLQNTYLKLHLKLKRKYQQPIKPLPLP